MPLPQCCFADSGTVSWGCNSVYEVTWTTYDCVEGAEFLGEWPPSSCTGTGGTSPCVCNADCERDGYPRDGSGGGTECFVAGTKITMGDGSHKNIEDVIIGDEVLSYNIHTNKIESKKVTELFTIIINYSPDPQMGYFQ